MRQSFGCGRANTTYPHDSLKQDLKFPRVIAALQNLSQLGWRICGKRVTPESRTLDSQSLDGMDSLGQDSFSQGRMKTVGSEQIELVSLE